MPDRPRTTPRLWAVAGALLLLHAVVAWTAVATKSVTVDEIFHVTGGYFYDKFGDYRIHPDNGVLPQRLHALPAVLLGAKAPPFEGNEYWRTSDVYVMSHQFFYESGNDHWPLLMAARTMNLLFSVGLCALVFVWARRLGGDVAGFTALTLAVFSPTLLAHGALATSDVAAALMLALSAGLFWWQLQQSGRTPFLLSAVVFGLACVTKYSAVLLLPVLIALAAWYIAAGRREATGRVLLNLLGHGLVAVLVIWTCFGFRYSAFAPGLPAADHLIRSWDWMLAHVGWQGRVIDFCRRLHLLPEAFLFGYTHTYVGAQLRGAFLAGEYSNQGWVYFFPLAFLWKSTPAELVGAGLVLVAALWHRARLGHWLPRLAPLLLFAAIYGAAALASHLNIGQRHLLPLYPSLFILTGVAVARLLTGPRSRLALAALLAGAQVVSCAGIYPHFLAYFNRPAGGPANGWRLLVDSSLDWGQDLAGLKQWLQRHNSAPDARPVFLSYFGSGEPAYYHITAERLPFVNGFKFPSAWCELTAGLYCISATSLQQVYSPFRGAWTPAWEKEYQESRRSEPLFREYWRNPSVRQELQAAGIAAAFETSWERYNQLRFARLCHFLRRRPADDQIGHSLLLYRLTTEELATAMTSPVPPP